MKSIHLMLMGLLTAAVLAVPAHATLITPALDADWSINGNLGQPGNWEYAIWDYEHIGTGATAAQGDYNYTSGESFDWELSFDVDAGVLSLAYGGAPTISHNYGSYALKHLQIFAVARPQNQNTTQYEVSVTDLVLTDNRGSLVVGDDLFSDDGSWDTILLQNLGVTEDWSLTGTTTFTWDGTRPRGNRMQFGVKGVMGEPCPDVPEPLTVAMIGLGLGSLALRKRRW